VLIAQAQHLRRRLEKRGGSARVDLLLRSRRSNEATLRTVVDEKDVCARELRYDWWRHNPRIHAEARNEGSEAARCKLQ
jgi:hypothetical protein